MGISLRLGLTVAAILVYSGVILVGNSLVLPSVGINGFVRVTPSSFDLIGTSVAPQAAQTPSPAGGADESFRGRRHGLSYLWLQPFGVHRRGLSNLAWTFGSFALLGTLSAALLFLFPQRIRVMSDLLRDEPFANHLLNALLGAIVYVVGYVLLRLSWLTITGLPFFPLLAAILWLGTLLGLVAVSFAAGRSLLRRLEIQLPPLAEALTGFWLLFVTGMVPYLGWVVAAVAAAIGLGCLLQTRLGTAERWSLSALEEERGGTPVPGNVLHLRRRRRP
ncbi:MAG: hypothetical protein KGJ86_16390 [Chloroflexota bacterium]|nr:hypothetical protein [Chloroflexota bacterium]